jgi:hypothetical protein
VLASSILSLTIFSVSYLDLLSSQLCKIMIIGDFDQYILHIYKFLFIVFKLVRFAFVKRVDAAAAAFWVM